MQNMLGACLCSMCPNQPSRAIVNTDKLKEVVKCLGEGEVSFDEFGTFTMHGQMIDQKYRPGKRDAGLDAIVLILSTEAVTLVHPKLYENGMLLLRDFYKHTKWTREKLESARVAPAEGAIPVTFFDALAWQIMKGPAKAADIAIGVARSVCRDAKNADRMACLLWKRDRKTKLYQGPTNLISRLGSKGISKALQVPVRPGFGTCMPGCKMLGTQNLIMICGCAQEDCMRTLVCLGQGDRIMRLAKVKSIPKHFAKVLMDGTDKTVETALWLIWRMTRDHDFCVRLVRNLDMVST
jgi:hypothetical protein